MGWPSCKIDAVRGNALMYIQPHMRRLGVTERKALLLELAYQHYFTHVSQRVLRDPNPN